MPSEMSRLRDENSQLRQKINSLELTLRARIEREPVVKTYYDKGKDAEHFEKLDDKAFAWELTCASQDLNDSDENVSKWMPVTALLSSAADRITALASASKAEPETSSGGWQAEAETQSAALAERSGIDMLDDHDEFLADLEATLIKFAEWAVASPHAPVVTDALRELEALTFVVQHNPRCPSPWLVRLPGRSAIIDMKHYGDPLGLTRNETGDILGFGKTFDEAARAALASREAT